MTDHASIDGSPPVSGGPVKPSQGTVRFRSAGGDQAAVTVEPKGYFAWLLAEGTERVTVHHLASLANTRVTDVMFTLDCAGVPIDHETRTVAIRDIIGANLA